MEAKQEDLLIETLEAVDTVLVQIHAQEQDYLRRVYVRFCLKKMLIPNKNLISIKNFPDRKSYSEYWYRMGEKEQYRLMTRNLIADVVDGKQQFNLDLVPNPELAFDETL